MNKTISLIATLAAITMILTTEVFAGDITIENPWARASASKAKSGGAFMTIKNSGTTPDKLIAARSDIAKRAEIHQTKMKDGMMMMHPVKAIEVPPGGMAMLKPGSYHVMFMGLKEPLRKGGAFPLTLVFEKAGAVEVMVKIMKPGTRSGKHKSGMHMKHSK